MSHRCERTTLDHVSSLIPWTRSRVHMRTQLLYLCCVRAAGETQRPAGSHDLRATLSHDLRAAAGGDDAPLWFSCGTLKLECLFSDVTKMFLFV